MSSRWTTNRKYDRVVLLLTSQYKREIEPLFSLYQGRSHFTSPKLQLSHLRESRVLLRHHFHRHLVCIGRGRRKCYMHRRIHLSLVTKTIFKVVSICWECWRFPIDTLRAAGELDAHLLSVASTVYKLDKLTDSCKRLDKCVGVDWVGSTCVNLEHINPFQRLHFIRMPHQWRLCT